MKFGECHSTLLLYDSHTHTHIYIYIEKVGSTLNNWCGAVCQVLVFNYYSLNCNVLMRIMVIWDPLKYLCVCVHMYMYDVCTMYMCLSTHSTTLLIKNTNKIK